MAKTGLPSTVRVFSLASTFLLIGSRYVYTIGVMYNVINCENASPPTTAIPSGRRDSEPIPVANATGSVATTNYTVARPNLITGLANGFIGRQQNGAWHTTTANLWGGLALEKFSKVFESTPVAGVTAATMGAVKAQVNWSSVERVKTTDAAGAPNQTTFFGAPASPGERRASPGTSP